jgi:RHS repeat-associated protein
MAQSIATGAADAASAGAYQHVLADAAGQPARLLDGTGAVVADVVLGPWGEALGATPRAAELLTCRLQGQTADVETGLHYHRFRYYDPATGRFLSPDPLGLLGSFHPYAYQPNAVGWIDPLALDWNYRLRNSSGGVYYSGRANDNQTPADVMGRHARTTGSDGSRFGPSDQLEVITPPGTARDAVRGIEDRSISDNSTNIGRRSCNGDSVRGNNIAGISATNPNGPSYRAAASSYLSTQQVGSAAQLPALSTHTRP